MASVQFSPIGNAAQFFNANGQVLNAGQLFTYAAGTSTPAATFTDATGTVAQANPIVLGVDGRVPQEVWLTAATAYKFVLEDSLNNTIAVWDNISGIAQSIVQRGYIAGLTMSTAGGSGSLAVAAGQATDGTGTISMALASALTKTTAAWAVGTNQGGLDTGAIANSTWYHFFLIYRSDTGGTEILFSTSVSNPALPTNYTNSRRIGSSKTDGSAHWTAFIQSGDTFTWSTPTQDVNAVNPGVSAVTRTLTVPTSVNVQAIINIGLFSSTFTIGGALPARNAAYISDLSDADLAPNFDIVGGTLISDVGQVGGNGTVLQTPYLSGIKVVRTNTSAQVRSRLNLSDATTNLMLATQGWIDDRGKNN